MQLLQPGQVPKRERRKDPNAVEKSPEYKALLQVLANNRLEPGQSAGLAFDKEDQKRLGMLWPARVTVDALKRWLAETQSTDLYQVRKFKTNDRWFVSVTRRKARQKRGTGSVSARVFNHGRGVRRLAPVRFHDGR